MGMPVLWLAVPGTSVREARICFCCARAGARAKIVGRRRLETVPDEIRGCSSLGPWPSPPAGRSSLGNASDAQLAPQAGDPLLADMDARASLLHRDPRSIAGIVRVLEHLLDQSLECASSSGRREAGHHLEAW